MKRFISLVFVLISLQGFGQFVNRSNLSLTVQDARLAALKNLVIPRYYDTTTANLSDNIGQDTSGAIIYTRNDNKIWKRGNSPKKWDEIGGGNTSGELLMTTTAQTFTGNKTFTGNTTFNGAVFKKVVTATLEYTVAADDYYIELPSGGNGVIVMPAPATNTGRVLIIRNGTENTFDFYSYQPIDASGNSRLNTGANAVFKLISNGTNWVVIN